MSVIQILIKDWSTPQLTWWGVKESTWWSRVHHAWNLLHIGVGRGGGNRGGHHRCQRGWTSWSVIWIGDCGTRGGRWVLWTQIKEVNIISLTMSFKGQFFFFYYVGWYPRRVHLIFINFSILYWWYSSSKRTKECFHCFRAGIGNRTRDLCLLKRPLYQLSYAASPSNIILMIPPVCCWTSGVDSKIASISKYDRF